MKAKAAATFQWGARFELTRLEPAAGPDGSTLAYLGTLDRHAVECGPDGERRPISLSRAQFELTRGERSRWLFVDLNELGDPDRPAVQVALGLRLTVFEATWGQDHARVQVDQVEPGAK
jgi:hypothetical protein